MFIIYLLIIILIIYLFFINKKNLNRIKILHEEIKILREENVSLSNKTVSIEKPKGISYAEWYLKKYGKKNWNVDNFQEYWVDICKDEYFAFNIRKISRYPKFLTNLIVEIQKFDFEKVSIYMKSVGWTWHDNEKEPPTVEKMIDNIFSLAEGLTTQDDEDSCSSGGFVVKRLTGDKAEITFTFKYYQ